MEQQSEALLFHHWLKRCRGALGRTQKAFADELGYAVETYRNIEQGETVTEPFGERLIAYLRLPPDQHPAFRTFMRTSTHPDPWPLLAQVLLNRTNQPSALQQSLPCPYPGMAPFTEAEHAAFFGRNQEVRELLRRLQLHPLLTIIGPSGSGKSSLVRAGLLPALRQHQALRAKPWQIQFLRPGTTPHTTLQQLLTSMLTHTLAVGNGVPVGSRDAPQPLLVIDPFEEIFTLGRNEAPAFQATLHELISSQACAVVLVVRADFYPDLMQGPLWPIIQNQRVEVTPLDARGLREAIVHPAQALDVSVEPALVERLIADAADAPGVLPLMQETLVLLWEQLAALADRQEAPQTLSLAMYERLGRGGRTGVQVAMAQRADAVLATLTLPQQALARRIVLRLIHFRDGLPDTRRQQALTALCAVEDDPALVAATVRILADRRLLIVGGTAASREQMVDLTHEALIEGWPTLQGWLSERREAEQTRRRLEIKAEEWVRLGRGAGGLLDAAQLPEAVHWLASPDARELGWSADLAALVAASQTTLEASHRAAQAQQEAKATAQRLALGQAQALAEAQQQRVEEQGRSNRRLRQRAVYLAVALGLALLAVTAAVVGFTQARQRTLEVQHQALVAVAQAALVSDDLDQALALALAAVDKQPVSSPDDVMAILYRAVDVGTRRRFTGHQDQVTSVMFSRDGTHALSGSSDRTVRLWDVTTGQEIQRFVGHTGVVMSVALSPDGTRALSASADHTVRLWDVTTGHELLRFVGHHGQVTSVTFSPDGTRALSGSADWTVQLWDVRTGRELKRFGGHTGDVMSVAFSPDGARALSGSADQTVRLWDVTTGRELQRFAGHHDQVTSVAFSPDGTRALSGSADRIVELWDVTTGRELQRFAGHQDRVTSVAFSPDRTYVLSGSGDRTVRLWDVTTGRELRRFAGHQDRVTSVAFSPDGMYVLSGSADQTMRLWDLTIRQELGQLQGHTATATSVVSSQDGAPTLSGSADQTMQLWDLIMRQELGQFHGHTATVTSVAFNPDGTLALSSALDRTVRLWDVTTRRELRHFTGHTDGVTSVAFSRDGTRALSGSTDQTMRLWDVMTGQELRRFTGRMAGVRSVAFSPDEQAVVSGEADGSLRLWELATGREVQRLSGHTAAVTSVAFSRDGAYILSGSADRTVGLWEVGTGLMVRRLRGHTGTVTSVAFSRDGTRALSGSTDGTVGLWDVASGLMVRRLRGHTAAVTSVAFSSDDTRALSGSTDRTMRLWDVTMGQELRRFEGHTATVTSVAFSPDGRTALSGSWDSSLRLWQIDTIADLITWVRANRYIPELTCEQRARYATEPFCPAEQVSPDRKPELLPR